MQADGVLKSENGTAVIGFRRRFEHPAEVIWAALTDPDQLIQWWGEAEVQPEVGGRFAIHWLNTDENGNSATMLATITEFEPPHRLTTIGDIHGELRWQLEPDSDEATYVTFLSTLELPDEYQSRTIAGWHFHLDALADVLNGEKVDLMNMQSRWNPIHEAYASRIG